MRLAKFACSLLHAGALFVLLSTPACAKTPPAAQSATSASSEATPAAAGQGDTTLPPGIDISKLDDFQKKVFFRISNNETSVCGQAQSLIASAKKDCRRSVNALRYVAKLVEQGYTDSEVSEAIGKRYRSNEVKTIDVSDAPMKGSPSAKITIVEFADYECPHCKRLQPVLRQVEDEFHNDVKIYFKQYPLPQHTNARLAAEAAVAANKQGKFWVYQDKLWDKQDELSPAVIEKLAKESGLDVAKFRQDLASDAVKARVQKDREQGEALGLSATPTVYINGREYTDPKDTESFRAWIKEELGR
ncbi:MAG TPA: thioredoxin domain-containing protein [Polyangia bacterium]|jgi:protein-disulfide isomerase|nr:thioredoxin domain-containing protein [Polyangia bacterium]